MIASMSLAEFVEHALRVPFVPRGRDYSGWDCWGVVRCAYRDVYGVDLPSYADEYEERDLRGSRLLGEVVARESAALWDRVPMNRDAGAPFALVGPGDVAVFRLMGRPVHVALVVDDRARALHAERRVGTFVEPLASPLWARRLEGVYRLAG